MFVGCLLLCFHFSTNAFLLILSISFLISCSCVKGKTVGTLFLTGITLVCTNLYGVQRTIVAVPTVISTLLYAALNTFVRMFHWSYTPFRLKCGNIIIVRHYSKYTIRSTSDRRSFLGWMFCQQHSETYFLSNDTIFLSKKSLFDI